MKFEAGKTYTTVSICDADMKISITVAKRTAKRLTTTDGKTLGISEYNGIEQVRPWGRYSMCPIIGADDLVGAEVVKVEPAAKEQSFDELMAEGEKLFTPSQFEEIKSLLTTIVDRQNAREPVKPTAKIYNFADYRKRG